MSLILRDLTSSDEAAFFDGLKEFESEDLLWYTFAWKPGMPYSEMLEILRKEKAGIDLAPNRVPHTMLYAFLDGKIIGRVSFRHHLNENLRQRGGHIGYYIAPRFRKQGYGTLMVKQALAHCKNVLGLTEIMISCADENSASWKVIEKFGGRLQDTVPDTENNELIRRYWITF